MCVCVATHVRLYMYELRCCVGAVAADDKQEPCLFSLIAVQLSYTWDMRYDDIDVPTLYVCIYALSDSPYIYV